MSVQHSGRWSQASELAGESIETGIWFRTQPRPWYARYSGIGALSELLLVVGSAILASTLRTFSPKPRNETEQKLDHSGSVLCARSAEKIFLMESHESLRGRHVARILATYPRRSLIHCDYHFDGSSMVTLEFDAAPVIQLYYIGGESELVRFVSTLSGSAQGSSG